MDYEKELQKKLDEYFEIFEDSFPTMAFKNMSDKRLITKVDKCLTLNKKAHVVFNLGLEDENILY